MPQEVLRKADKSQRPEHNRRGGMADRHSGALQDVEIVELYRILGEDFAFYGLTPPAHSAQPLGEGYRAGQARHRKPQRADRFVRKWLQLRHQALKRGRAVSDDVDVDFLRRLDVPVCPVTLQPLTHGERKPTDWSVDRLNNNGAYALSNLAIMSTHANLAKASKSLSEVRKLALGASSVDGLAPKVWARMAAMMYGPCCHQNLDDWYYVRQVAPIPEQVTRFAWQALQDCLVRIAVDVPQGSAKFQRPFMDRLPNNQLKGMAARLVRGIQKLSSGLCAPFDAWFDDELSQRYKLFFEFLLECTKGNPLSSMVDFYTRRDITEDLSRELRYATRGYYR